MSENEQKIKVAKQVEELVRRKQYARIKELFSPHPEDIANVITNLSNPSYKLLVFRLVPYDKAVDVFEYLSTEEEENILNSLTSNEIEDILNEMSPDDRTELFDEMPAEIAKRFINLLSPDKRTTALQILNYPDYSIGRLITPYYVQLFADMTVAQSLEHIRQVGLKKETIYHCYVLDKEKRLIGIASLKKMVLADPQTKIADIMSSDVIKVDVYTDQEEAANLFKKYDLLALPVVVQNDKLIGIVTFDDLVDILEDETTEDFERIAAVLPVEKPYMEANFFSLLWKRSFWLILLAVLESASSLVMKGYDSVIHTWIALTFFLPVLIATAGNAGMQSAMMIVRGLATGDIAVKDFFKIIFRESFLGICLGAILALVGVIRVFLQQGDWQLSVSVGIAMGITILIAALTGAMLPLLFRKLKLDPALMSGPLITTIVDVGGIFIYFEVAQLLLKL